MTTLKCETMHRAAEKEEDPVAAEKEEDPVAAEKAKDPVAEAKADREIMDLLERLGDTGATRNPKKAMQNAGETAGTGVHTVNEAGETFAAPVADVAAPVERLRGGVPCGADVGEVIQDVVPAPDPVQVVTLEDPDPMPLPEKAPPLDVLEPADAAELAVDEPAPPAEKEEKAAPEPAPPAEKEEKAAKPRARRTRRPPPPVDPSHLTTDEGERRSPRLNKALAAQKGFSALHSLQS